MTAAALAAFAAACSTAPTRSPSSPRVVALPESLVVRPADPAPFGPAIADPSLVQPAPADTAPDYLALSGLFPADLQSSSTPPPMDTRMSYERNNSEPFSFGHFTLDAEWIPAMWVTADVDVNGPNGSRSDLDTGSGVLFRAGLGSTTQNIGIQYMETWHDEMTGGHSATTQQLLLDFLYRAPLPGLSNLVWLEVDAGLGGARLAFAGNALEDNVTGSALLHGDLEFRVAPALALAVGGGAFVWGHFGDTLAYGSYVTLGAKLIF